MNSLCTLVYGRISIANWSGLFQVMGSDNDGGFNGVANVKSQLGIETDNSESISKAQILC